MKKDKILVRINNLDELKEYKKLGISNFLFALRDFSVGYDDFSLKELFDLRENVYLLINRVLDNDSITKLEKIIPDLSFVKGILFEDIGVYQLLKNINIPLIWNQNHFAVNLDSINIWLNKVSSVVISNELEKTELEYILNNIKSAVILPVLGLNMAMYSRRYLLSFFNEYKHLKKIKKAILSINENEFLAVENKYGCALFYNKYFNLINEIDSFNDEKILFYYIDPNMLSVKDVERLLNGNNNNNIDNRFYNKKTVYRIGDLDD